MLLDEFQRLTQSQGVRRVGQQYYGVWQSYPYSAVVTPSGRGTVAFSFRLGATLESVAFKQLRRQMPKCAVLLAAGGSTYRLTINGKPFDKGDEALASILDTLARGLRESGVTAGELCPICHRGGCDALADLGGYGAVHYACAANRTADAAAEAQRSLRSGSYVTGFIGAFLGGLVACIPTILAYYAGWLVGYLYALIPLGAYYGYKLFHGRMNRGAFICTCIASVIHLFSMEQVIFYIEFVKAFDLWPSIFDTIWLYFQLLTPADMLKDMWMSAIFMLLGLWISWDRIRRNAYTDLHGASSVMETLSYLPGREPQTAAEPLEEADGPVIQAVEFSAPEQPL